MKDEPMADRRPPESVQTKANPGLPEIPIIERISVARMTVSRVDWRNRVFEDFNARETRFEDCDFRFSNFERAYFKDAKFSNCRFDGSRFSDCNFRGATFYRCDLKFV